MKKIKSALLVLVMFASLFMVVGSPTYAAVPVNTTAAVGTMIDLPLKRQDCLWGVKTTSVSEKRFHNGSVEYAVMKTHTSVYSKRCLGYADIHYVKYEWFVDRKRDCGNMNKYKMNMNAIGSNNWNPPAVTWDCRRDVTYRSAVIDAPAGTRIRPTDDSNERCFSSSNKIERHIISDDYWRSGTMCVKATL